MSVYLIEREGGKVLTQALDIKHGKTVEAKADAVRDQQIGEAVVDWWVNGKREWLITVHGKDPKTGGRSNRPFSIDLRKEMRRHMVAGGRISPLSRYLDVEPLENRSVVMGAYEDNYLSIGRDVVSWYQECARLAEAHGIRIGVLINQSWRTYEYRKDKERHLGKGTPGLELCW